MRGGGGSPGYGLPEGLYRDPAHGKVAGVCAGLGAYFQIRPKFIRIAAVVGSLFGFFPVIAGLYVLLTMILPVRPEGMTGVGEGEDRPRPSVDELKRRFESLDHRLARMEELVISEDFRLRQKFREL